MTTQQNRASQYENDFAAEVWDKYSGEIFARRSGYSGNGVMPCGDVYLDAAMNGLHSLEIKKAYGDTDQITIDEEDMEQLGGVQRSHPRHVNLWAVAKFPHRRIVAVEITPFYMEKNGESVVKAERMAKLAAQEDERGFVRAGDKNLLIDKPELSEWESSQTEPSGAEYFVEEHVL